MKTAILHSFAMNLHYANGLIKDIPESRYAEQPAGVPNHPAWVLGHLALSADFALFLLGEKPLCPESYKPLFDNGSKPTTDLSQYPSKTELLTKLTEAHAAVAAALTKAPDSLLAAPLPMEGMRKYFPTNADAIVFLLTAHEGTHLGQLSSWRRANGLPSVY